MHSSLAHTAHRPWPMPTKPWAWRQSWRNLLFAHWPVDPSLLSPLIPPQLKLQEFDGTAWLGVVPFEMAGVMRRPLPDLPGISAFPEINVRTYVEFDGRPGVWFLSLDAANRLAVFGARQLFHLPYYFAAMDVSVDDENVVTYFTKRAGDTPASFSARYWPTGPVRLTDPGTLDHWLTERYCLYTLNRRGRLFSAEVHHPQWPLRQALLTLRENTMAVPFGIELPEAPTLLHYSKRVDVVVWNLQLLK